jgi:hypothetical protein
VRDSKNFTAVCDNAEEPSDSQKHAARMTVCSSAKDAADATLLLQMLGLFPGQNVEGCSPMPMRGPFS